MAVQVDSLLWQLDQILQYYVADVQWVLALQSMQNHAKKYQVDFATKLFAHHFHQNIPLKKFNEKSPEKDVIQYRVDSRNYFGNQ